MGNILRGVLTCVRQHSVRVDVEYATLILNILCLDSMGKVRKRRPACRGPRESSCFGTVRPALEHFRRRGKREYSRTLPLDSAAVACTFGL